MSISWDKRFEVYGRAGILGRYDNAAVAHGGVLVCTSGDDVWEAFAADVWHSVRDRKEDE